MIKPKSLMDYISEDASLSQKITYEEFQNFIQTGFDNSGIEEAYGSYCDFIYQNDK